MNMIKDTWYGRLTKFAYKIKDLETSETLTEQTISDLCLEVETAICETLLHKLFLAQKKYNISTLMLSGGVSANKPLRKQFLEKAKNAKCTAFIPVKFEYCTDNAAMIGAAAQIIWNNSTEKQFPVEAVKIQMHSL